jgi:mono/diheme cytochrome c family protein
LRLLVFIGLAAFAIASCSRSGSDAARPLTAEESRGQRLYQGSCATCHRPNSTDPLNGPGLQGLFRKPYLPSGAPANDERVREVIKQGRRTMPGYGQIFDDRQINDVIAYLKTL